LKGRTLGIRKVQGEDPEGREGEGFIFWRGPAFWRRLVCGCVWGCHKSKGYEGGNALLRSEEWGVEWTNYREFIGGGEKLCSHGLGGSQ